VSLLLRIDPFELRVQLVQPRDVRLGRGDDDVRVGADAIDDAPGARQPHRHFALRLGAVADRVDRKQHQLGAAGRFLFDRSPQSRRPLHRPCLSFSFASELAETLIVLKFKHFHLSKKHTMSTSPLDAAALTHFLVSKILVPLGSKIGGEIVEFSKLKWTEYSASLENYLSETQNRHKYFSSQVFANDGQLLDAYYIPLTLQKVNPSSDRASIKVAAYPDDLFSAYKDILIVDTAGMGKSTLLKYIFLRAIENAEHIPIFVELRKLSKENTLFNFLMSELKLKKFKNGEDYLRACLKRGIFTFLLDGFDEVTDANKEAASAQIIDLKRHYNQNRFILSSRDEESLAYLQEFYRFQIQPLVKEEAFELIKRISPHAEVASSLIAKLEANSSNLDEFLTNPLLVSLLVRSFIHSPVLPVRLSEFYRQVFDALFQNHDAKKELGGFSRAKRSGLDLDRFHKALRALGALTYKDKKLEFSTDEMLSRIESAKVLASDTTFSASNFRHDLLHAVPLFVQEGNSIRWAHRSLQEYFAAAYICFDSKQDQIRLLAELHLNGISRNINLLKLCADIDPKTFKTGVVKAYLTKLRNSGARTFTTKNFPGIPEKELIIRRTINMSSKIGLCVLQKTITLDRLPDGLPPSMLERYNFFWMLDESGKSPNEKNIKAKYIFGLANGPGNPMDDLLFTYFQRQILALPAQINLSAIFSDIKFGEILQINNSPANPLNSSKNFALTNQLLMNLSRNLRIAYNLDEINNFRTEIIGDEKNSQSLTISF
jgi:hypothetical protein